MKNWLAVAFSALLVVRAATHVLPLGKIIEYKYSTRVNSTGDIGDQAAVHIIESVVRVSTENVRVLGIEFTKVKVGQANQVFTDTHYDDIRLSENSHYKDLLKPYWVEFNADGTLSLLKFHHSDSDWSINFKKAFANILQIIKLDPDYALGNVHYRQLENQEIGSVAEAYEPSLSGVCKSIYNFRLTTTDRSKPNKVEITKVRDLKDCKFSVPYYTVSTHRRFKCADCEADKSHPLSRNSACKYEGELDDGKNLLITEVECTGLLKYSPFGTDTESINIEHNQTLQFLKSYPLRDESSQRPQSEQNSVLEEPTYNIFEKLMTIRNPKNLSIPITYRTLYEEVRSRHDEVRRLIIETASLIDSHSVDSQPKILDRIILIQRGLFTMPLSKLEEIANFLSSRTKKGTAWILFWDTVAITATNPCIKLCLDSYQNGLITSAEIVNLLPSIATHVGNPNLLLVEAMREFMLSSKVQRDQQVAITTYLTFGSLVAHTCADGIFEMPMTPSIAYSFCADNHRRTYVKELERLLDRTDDDDILSQIALLKAVGNTALVQGLPVIERYMYRNDSIDIAVQSQAVYSLALLTKQHRELVRGPLISVLFNSNDNTEARIAAFNVLIASRPDKYMYEKIATICQNEDDKNLCAYIYSTFSDYANATNPCLAEVSAHAKNALNLMDDEHDTSAWMGSTTIIEGLMENVDAASFERISFLGDADSLVPKLMYLQLNGLISDYTSDIATVASVLKHPSFVIESLIGSDFLFGKKTFLQQLETFGEPLRNLNVHDDLEKVGYQMRQQPEFEGVILTTFMDLQQRIRKVDKTTLHRLAQTIRSSSLKLWQGVFIDLQKTAMPVDVHVLLPIEAGFITYITAQNPLHVGVKAKLQVLEFNKQKVQFNVIVKPQLAVRVSVKAGILTPEGNHLAAGFDTCITLAPLVDGKVELSLTYSNAVVAYKPNSQESDDRKVLHYCIRPYTVIEPIWELKPLLEIAKHIHVRKPHQYTIPLLGNSINVKVKHEHEVDDDDSLTKFLKEDNTLSGHFNFWWLNDELTPHEYEVVLKRLSIRELRYEMQWNYQPDDANPDIRIKNMTYILWNQLFAPNVPIDCEYQSQAYESRKGDRRVHEEFNDYKWSDYETGSRPFISKKSYSDKDWDSETESGEGNSWERRENPRSPWLGEQISTSEAHRHHPVTSRDIDDLEITSAKLRSGKSIWEINARAIMKADTEKGYNMDFSLEKYPSDDRTRVKIDIKPIGKVSARMYCFEANHFSEQRPPCFFGRYSPNLRKAHVLVHSRIRWGSECTRPEAEVKLKLVARKTIEQLDVATEDRPWFYDQCEEDVANGNPMSDACMRKVDHLTDMNSVKAIFSYNELPLPLLNATAMIKDYLISQFYSNLKHYPMARSQENQLVLDLKFHYGIPVVDFSIEAPSEKLNFSKIYYGDVVPFFDAPSTTKSFVKRILDYYSDGDLTPTCTVTDRYVNTFNNDTYELRTQDGCDYIVAADPTPKKLFSILLRNNTRGSSQDKTLTVKVNLHVIEIDPSGHNPVRLNDREIRVESNTITLLSVKESKTGLLGYVVRHGNFYQLSFPFHRLVIQFNGKSVKIYTSHLWRKKIAGICGERNSETDNPFVGPRSFAYTEGSDFANSYMIPSSECRRPQLIGERFNTEDVTYRYVKSIKSSCYDFRPVVKRLGKLKMCVSTEDQKLCSEKCRPQGTTVKRLEFQCVDVTDPRAREIAAIASSSSTNVFKSLVGSTMSFSTNVDLPSVCEPNDGRHFH